MVNKTIKAAVSASLVLSTGLVWAYGNNVNAGCNAIGNQTVVENCKSVQQIPGKAARGDKVTFTSKFMAQFERAPQLQSSGSFAVPEPETYAFYKLGTIRILIGTFDLKADHSKAPNALQTILRDAKIVNPNANSLVWFGRALNGETAVTEVAQVTSDLSNPTGAPIHYEKTGPASVKIHAPFQSQAITVDMQPIVGEMKKEGSRKFLPSRAAPRGRGAAAA